MTEHLNSQSFEVEVSNFCSDSSQECINELKILVVENEQEMKSLVDSNDKMKEAFHKITKNYMECLRRSQNERDCSNNAIIKELRRKLNKQEERIEDLESENENLLREIKGYEDYIANQVEQMKKLSYYIDFLGQDSGRRQDEYSKTSHEDNKCQYHQQPPDVNLFEPKLTREQENNKTLLELIKGEQRLRQNTEDTLSQTMRMCEDLMHKNQILKHQNELCASQCEELKNLSAKAQKADELESERKGLVTKIRECMCHMNNQDATISSLTYDMKTKTEKQTQREGELSSTIEEMKIQIAENEQQLAENKKQLEQFAMEKICMSARVDELERQVGDYEWSMSLREDNNKVLLSTLEQEKTEKLKLQNALEKITKIQEHLSEMLAQARCTIKSITHKLEEYDIERLETQRDAQIKISELEGRLVVANVTIKKLRENLDEMKGIMDKNVALRTLSAQLHQTANAQVTQLQDANEDLSKKSHNLAEMYNYLKKVLYEKDKTFDDLRNQLVGLKERLDNEQRLRADTEMALKDVTAAGDSEVINLKNVIHSLKREINRLNLETECLMKTSPVGKLKTRNKKLEQENVYLRNEVKRFADYLQKILPGYINPKELAKLKAQLNEMIAEVKRQKQEVENQRKRRIDEVDNITSKLAQQAEHYKRLEEFIKNNAGLRAKKANLQTVVIVEKQNKDDGDAKYHCLYGAEGGKKKQGSQKLERSDKEDPNKKKTSEAELLQGDNKYLKGEVKRLKRELESAPRNDGSADFSEERDKLLNEIDSQKQEIADLLYQINNTPVAQVDYEVLDQLKVENEKLKKMLQDQQKQLKTSRSLFEEPVEKTETSKMLGPLKEALEMEQNRVSEIQELWNQCEEKNDALKKKIAELTQENAALKAAGPELENQVNQLQAENARPKSEQQNLAQPTGQLKPKVVIQAPAESHAPLADDNPKLKELEMKLRQNEHLNSNLQAELDRMRFLRMSMVNVVEQDFPDEVKMQETITKLQEENYYLKQKVPKTQSTENLVHATKGESDPRVKELEQRLEEWQNSYYNDIGKLKAQIELFNDIPGGAEGYLARINELESKLQEYQRKNELLEKNNALLEAENQQFAHIPDDDEQAPNSDETEDKKIRDLVEHLRAMERRNEALKTRTIQLELDNGRLRDDLERIMGKEHRTFQKEMDHLRDLEKQSARCQEKYQHLRKRLMKLEIENRNLKKEYISTLIEKEKLILQSHEQAKRLRETTKLLRKTQEKKQSLTSRLIKMQVDNENLKQQLDSVINEEVEKHMETLKDTDNILEEKNRSLEFENQQLRQLLQRLGDSTESLESSLPPEVQEFLLQPRTDELKFKNVQLSLENKNLRTELEGIKIRDLASLEGDLVDQRVAERLSDMRQIDDDQKLQLKTVELEIENEFLKSELENRDKWGIDAAVKEKHMNELDDEIHKLKDTNENLKRVTVELELDNEYLKKEMERMSKAKETTQAEAFDRNLDKQIHALKMKIENQEAENKQLKQDLDTLGQVQVSLEQHAQLKIIEEIERLLQEYQDIKTEVPQKSRESMNSDINEMENRLQLWKDQYEPQILELKRNLQALAGKETNYITKLEKQLSECKSKCSEFEQDNKNFRVALEVLLKEKDIIKNVKLVKEVEEQLQKYRHTETLRKMSEADVKRVVDLEQRLKDCQNTNKLLRAEKISLNSQLQDQKIRELEAQVRQLQMSKAEEHRLREKRSKILSTVDLQKADEEIHELKSNKDFLTSGLEKLREEKDIMEGELKYQIRTCQNEKEELTHELERLRKLNDLQQRVKSDLEKELENLRNSTSDVVLAKKGSKEKRVFFDVEDRLSEYEKENESLKEEYLKLHEEFEEKLHRIHQLEEQLKKCQDMNKRLKDEIGMMHPGENTSASDTRRSSESLDDKRRMYKKGNDDSEDKPTEGEQKLKDIQKENDNLKMKLEELQNAETQLMESRGEIQNLTKDFEKVRQENLALKNQAKKVKELETRLKESQFKYKGAKMQVDKLEKDKSIIQARKADRRIISLEGELIETRTENEINKTKVEYLRKQIASHDAIEKENKHLKDEINRLTRKLQSYDEDNKKLKNQVNELTQERHESIRRIDDQKKNIEELQKERHELIRKNDNQNREMGELLKEKHELIRRNDEHKKEIAQLQNQIRLLGGGEYKAVSIELQERNTENKQLKLVISELQEQIYLSKLELEERNNDTREKRVRKLEETLTKYQDNNEYLKVKIDQLEDEKNNMMMELTTYIDNESKILGTESSPTKKLEAILRKYQDTDQNLMERANQTSLQNKRVKDLEEQVRQCQVENERLKLVTIQLEAEINCLKRDILSIRDELVPTEKTLKQLTSEETTNRTEHELDQQKKKWKTIVSKLTQEYEENISLLKRRLQPLAPTLVSENPWMVGSTQPSLLPTAYTAMPFMWQPFMPYLAPPPSFDEKSSGNLQQLSSMVNNIQKNLKKSKRVLDSELVKATAEKQCRQSEEEEQEQVLLDYETEITTAEEIPQYTDIDENITELNKQFTKQRQTKSKIEKLQSDIQETIRSLREVSQTSTSERPFFVTQVDNNEMPSTSTITKTASVQRECSIVTSRSSSLVQHVHGIPKAESSDSKKRTSVKPSQSSGGKAGGKKKCNSSEK